MAFKNLVAFGAGEITPELSERGNLEKFRTGLKKLRNAQVTKMGGLADRAGTVHVTDLPDDCRLYVAGNTGKLFVFGTQQFTVYSGYDKSAHTFANTHTANYDDIVIIDPELLIYTVDQLKALVFTHSEDALYAAVENRQILRIDMKTFAVKFIYMGTEDPNVQPDIPLVTVSNNTAAPTGYFIQYLITGVKDGVENPTPLYTSTGNSADPNVRKMPAGANQGLRTDVHYIESTYNNVTNTMLTAYDTYDTVRFYRRPLGAGEYGFIGESAPTRYSTVVGTTTTNRMMYAFSDFGGAADYSQNPSGYLRLYTEDSTSPLPPMPVPIPIPIISNPTSCLVYQDRLIFNGTNKRSRVFGTMTGTLNILRHYPLRDDSAIGFAITSDGGGNAERFFDGRGLVITTDVGIYETPSDILKYSTSYAIKKSNLIHYKMLPVLGVDSSMLIYDDRLKGVFRLVPNGDNYPYSNEEISVYSAHLFKDRKINSWDIMSDFTQFIIMITDDGEAILLAYQNDQMLRAFSWYDTDGKFLEIGVMKVPSNKDAVFFKMQRGNKVTLEVLSDRDENRFSYMNLADSAKIFPKHSSFAITLHIPENGDLSDSLYLSQAGMVNLPYEGAEGTIFRVFDPLTRNFIEVYVEEFISSSLLKVKLIGGNTEEKLKKRNIVYEISNETPTVMDGVTVDRKITFKQQDCYKTTNIITGLTHLNGKKVSIRKDGFTHASPLNTTRGYDEYTVTGGQITLSDDDYGSIFVVGLPYCTDIGTLAVDTVEQSPVKLESQITNKVWLSFNESRGCYLGSEFPEDGGVEGMDNSEDMKVTEQGIDVNQPMLPYSTRDEHTMVGDWNTGSAICIRKVDPQPLGLKAIILDSEIIRR